MCSDVWVLLHDFMKGVGWILKLLWSRLLRVFLGLKGRIFRGIHFGNSQIYNISFDSLGSLFLLDYSSKKTLLSLGLL